MKKKEKNQIPATDNDVLLYANEILTKIRAPITDSTIEAAQASFRDLLRCITIQTQAQLYTDLTSITMIASAREQARVQMLNRTTTLLQEIQSLLTEEALTIRTESENYGRQFARESAHDAVISEFKKNDPIAHMCHVLSRDIVSAKKVRDLAYDFKNNLQELKQRFCHEKINSILEIFTDISRFCMKFLQDEEDIRSAVGRVRESLVSLVGQTISIQQDIAPNALTKANVPSPFRYGTPTAQAAPESVTSLEPSRSFYQEQMPALRQHLRLNRDNMYALSRATNIPIDILLRIKSGTQTCAPATLKLIIQEAAKLSPLSEGEEEYRGEIQPPAHHEQTKKLRMTKRIAHSSVETGMRLDPHELISDDGYITRVMESYNVTLEELFACPQNGDIQEFQEKLQNLREIIGGSRQCARKKLMTVRKSIEDSCVRMLEKKTAEADGMNDLRKREKDTNAEKKIIDTQGIVKGLLKSKNKPVATLFMWMKDVMPTHMQTLGRRITPAQKSALEELSRMELLTLMNIINGITECSLPTYKILEDMTNEFIKRTQTTP